MQSADKDKFTVNLNYVSGYWTLHWPGRMFRGAGKRERDGGTEGERERGRRREREREGQRERQRDRETKTDRQTETERQQQVVGRGTRRRELGGIRPLADSITPPRGRLPLGLCPHVGQKPRRRDSWGSASQIKIRKNET